MTEMAGILDPIPKVFSVIQSVSMGAAAWEKNGMLHCLVAVALHLFLYLSI